MAFRRESSRHPFRLIFRAPQALSVKNTGTGLTATRFEPYETSNRPSEGSMEAVKSTASATRSQAQRIVDRWGGVAAMVETSGYGFDTAIRNWIRAGVIPDKHHLPLLLAARAAGVDLTPADFYAHLVEALIASAGANQVASESSDPAAVRPAA
jgi:hypothetical protein